MFAIGFSTKKHENAFSYVIKKVENTKYSHVYLKFYSKSLDRYLVYHATGDGLYFLGFVKFSNENKIFKEYLISASEEEKTKILKWCVDNSGKEYGKLQIIGIGIVRLIKHLFGKVINNPFANGDKKQVCDETVARVLQILGYNFIEADIEREGPKWIDNFIEKNLRDRILGIKEFKK